MSTIGGKVREQKEFTKQVGLFEAEVITINPTVEEYKEILNIDLKEDSKAANYLSEDEDGNKKLRIDVHIADVKTGNRYKIAFHLADKAKMNKDLTKKQYINSVGVTSWADDPNNLPDWFKAREYRVAYAGEEELYNFLRSWLGKLDYRDAETTLQLDWKTLMKGNVKDLRAQIGGEFSVTIGCLATIASKESDGEVKEYQNVYNKAFFPAYTLKTFRLVDYSDPTVIDKLAKRKNNELKFHERFVLNVVGQYGCKDYYILKDIQDYNPSDNIAASDSTKMEESKDDSSYL